MKIKDDRFIFISHVQLNADLFIYAIYLIFSLWEKRWLSCRIKNPFSMFLCFSTISINSHLECSQLSQLEWFSYFTIFTALTFARPSRLSVPFRMTAALSVLCVVRLLSFTVQTRMILFALFHIFIASPCWRFHSHIQMSLHMYSQTVSRSFVNFVYRLAGVWFNHFPLFLSLSFLLFLLHFNR